MSSNDNDHLMDVKTADTNQEAIVAIVGRPNVGKSTLFNRLVGRKMALVYDQPGVTRDIKSAKVQLGALSFELTDTPGLFDPGESDQPAVVTEGMRAQAMKALSRATVVMFVIDGRNGCTPFDLDLANLLRKTHVPVIVVVNKSEGNRADAGLSDAYALGLSDVVAISAEHGLGLHDLEVSLENYITPDADTDEDDDEDAENFQSWNDEIDGEDVEETTIIHRNPLKLAIVGRPNVGKSTLVNALLGEEEQLTADYPGVTRDSISFEWKFNDRSIELVDTAGIRRRSKIDTAVEKLAIFDAERTIQFAEVVILVIDASIPMEELIEKQDLTLAAHVLNEGRGLIIALNKWDKVKNPAQIKKHIHEQLEVHLAQAKDVPCITISALLGKSLETLIETVLDIEKLWNRRISTAKLNEWLRFTIEAHPAPIVSGHRIRLKYITQIKTRPPTFRVFCTKAADIPDSYVRYLTNTMRKDFNMPAVPLRFLFKAQKNPYSGKKG